MVSLVVNLCHVRAKHVELELHFVREMVLENKLMVQHILSTEQPVDALLKPLSITHFLSLRPKLSVFILPLSFEGCGNKGKCNANQSCQQGNKIST